MYILIISKVAKEDIQAIDEYYRNYSIDRANDFLIDIQLKIEKIESNPKQYQYIDKPQSIRRAFLDKFPYTIFYQVDVEQQSVILLTVVGQSDSPEKWPK